LFNSTLNPPIKNKNHILGNTLPRNPKNGKRLETEGTHLKELNLPASQE